MKNLVFNLISSDVTRRIGQEIHPGQKNKMGHYFPKIHRRWIWNYGNKEDVKCWIDQFNSLRKTTTIDTCSFGNHLEFMDLYIYKGKNFYMSGI
jgi:hypothetical protein